MKAIVPAGVLALVLAGGGYWYMTQQNAAPEPEPVAQSEDAAPADDAASDFAGVVEMVQGNPDATVEVIEYASFTCPHCASFHSTAYKQLRSDYIDTGKIKFVYREVYFDKYGMWGSLIARCAGPEKFFGIVDLIYKGQNEWARAGSDAAIADELRKIGRLAGMSTEQMDACLADGAKLEQLVGWYQQNAERDDINSTPSFVINGQKYSNMNFSDFSAILDEQLGG
ncbi:DsbA family protein [Thalassococcus lentus]|uniref:DsbA family protein n=1 Tax=Thalassococcus lentus TaxID=1210524 RepID=A0ABT4XWT5_9RHOB|nr:DsbA family protein [Thalassococcus lentus]MDA7426424.1 DsbA family protein [Thalassococcus lentus]